jgi:hypothetical protein
VELIQVRCIPIGDEAIDHGLDLGEYADETTAKAAAQRWESHGPDDTLNGV